MNNNSGDIDPDNITKVKFICSYGGKIQPRPHDNQLSYIGGETKILAVDRSVNFTTLIAKLSALCDRDVCFKYQLPGEDLDALISVTNDDDLQHMMHEYDRLNLSKPSHSLSKLRLFLLPLTQTPALTPVHSFGSIDPRSEQQHIVDHQISDPKLVTQEIELHPIQKHIQDDNEYFGAKLTGNVAPVTEYQITDCFTTTTISPDQQPVYVIQNINPAASVYQTPNAMPVNVMSHVGHGQGYYVHACDQQGYSVMAPQAHVATQQTTVSSQQQFVAQTYTEAAYDGRQVYYTTTHGAVVASTPQPLQPQYQAMDGHVLCQGINGGKIVAAANVKDFI
ncbi:hypothetical protein QVD17_05808 [Tagetes erecta]|uniref:PB1 domain-containing protein n=1 Tax=Tagetes erecta TaxID=13708 RepID=A0AAD8PAU7_TARER|nr:hypothetical protein QVD17_05808 [Tagetes erecta]